ncbi:hypothetical protein EJ02DRAFT_36351 [Clathrospora elynae]|uniref:Uncharacterized protein n=1 Tax=Clathrospora elynae TaxID=706981 RepID=A0A6A5T0C3_9PLEO|nr:hypothetical protein EJ02DRAFT_36351 [Clathrospora elynae]
MIARVVQGILHTLFGHLERGRIWSIVDRLQFYNHTKEDIKANIYVGLQWSEQNNLGLGCNKFQNSNHIDENVCVGRFLAAMNHCDPKTLRHKYGQHAMTLNWPDDCLDFWLIGHKKEWTCEDPSTRVMAPECWGVKKQWS